MLCLCAALLFFLKKRRARGDSSDSDASGLAAGHASIELATPDDMADFENVHQPHNSTYTPVVGRTTPPESFYGSRAKLRDPGHGGEDNGGGGTEGGLQPGTITGGTTGRQRPSLPSFGQKHHETEVPKGMVRASDLAKPRRAAEPVDKYGPKVPRTAGGGEGDYGKRPGSTNGDGPRDAKPSSPLLIGSVGGDSTGDYGAASAFAKPQRAAGSVGDSEGDYGKRPGSNDDAPVDAKPLSPLLVGSVGGDSTGDYGKRPEPHAKPVLKGMVAASALPKPQRVAKGSVGNSEGEYGFNFSPTAGSVDASEGGEYGKRPEATESLSIVGSVGGDTDGGYGKRPDPEPTLDPKTTSHYGPTPARKPARKDTSHYDAPEQVGLYGSTAAAAAAARASTWKAAEAQWVIPAEDVVSHEEIGRGSFGVVVRGTWRGDDVAIKNVTELSEEALSDFRREAVFMMNLPAHQHVLRLVGLMDEPVGLVTDYAALGSLHDYLGTDVDVKVEQLVEIIHGVADGMSFLHKNQIIHREYVTQAFSLSSFSFSLLLSSASRFDPLFCRFLESYILINLLRYISLLTR